MLVKIQAYLLKFTAFGVKFILANVLAIIVTTLIIYFIETSNNPLPWIPDPLPFAHRIPNSHICMGTEGFIYGNLDSNGLNNLYCVRKNLQVSSPEIDKHTPTVSSLLFGSSHMEAYYVPVDKNCCFLINEHFESTREQFLLYNLGYGGKFIVELVGGYSDVLDYFQPNSSVIFETPFLPSPKQVKDMSMKGKSLVPASNKPIKFLMQYALSLRYMILQVKRALNNRQNSSVTQVIEEEGWNEENVGCLREFLSKISEPSKARGVQPLLFFHPHFTLHEDGSATLDPNPGDVELYRSICEEQGIIFLYLGDRFMREYEEKNILPYGFWNTLPNSGHLNKDGHRMVAEELCKVIDQLEATRKENVQ